VRGSGRLAGMGRSTMAGRPNDLSALYRDKAEETRTIAEAIGNCSARASMLEVAATLERMADEEEKKGVVS